MLVLDSLTDSLDLIIMDAYIPGQLHSQLKGIDSLSQIESFGSGDTEIFICIKCKDREQWMLNPLDCCH